MKSIAIIAAIIINMPDHIFDTLQNADYDRWSVDKRVAKNGLNRLRYHLNKYNLTVKDWDMWSAQ